MLSPGDKWFHGLLVGCDRSPLFIAIEDESNRGDYELIKMLPLKVKGKNFSRFLIFREGEK